MLETMLEDRDPSPRSMYKIPETQGVEQLYTDSTQTLTERGWVDICDIYPKEKVAQYHTDGRIDFVEHKGKRVSFYEGEVFQFINNDVNLAVTPSNHCCYRKSLPGPLYSCEAKNLPNTAYLPISATDGDTPDTASKRSVKSFDEFERFKIATMYYGHINYGLESIRLFFINRDKLKHYLRLLAQLEIKHEEKRLGLYTEVCVYPNYPSAFLDVYRQFPLAMVSFDWARAFLKELTYWGGHYNDDGNLYIRSKNKDLVDYVQAVSVLGGYHTELKKDLFGMAPSFSLVLRENQYFYTGEIERRKSFYTGPAYNVCVPTQSIVLRHNNKTIISSSI